MDDDLSLHSPKCLLIAKWKACAVEAFYHLLIKAEGLCEEEGQFDITKWIGYVPKNSKVAQPGKKMFMAGNHFSFSSRRWSSPFASAPQMLVNTKKSL